jgi:hypothetical protein
MPKIKCQRCAFRGEQAEFPRKPNLQYYKTCGPCTTKKAEKRQAKDGDRSKRRAAGKDRTPGGIPTLVWSAFISTIEENKDSAFELHAIVTLESDETAPKAPLENSAHGLAKNIAKEAWDATGFRFKYV